MRAPGRPRRWLRSVAAAVALAAARAPMLPPEDLTSGNGAGDAELRERLRTLGYVE